VVASDRHDGQLQRNLNRVGHRRLQLTVEGGRDHRLARARRAGDSDDAAHGAAWRGYCQHSGVVSPVPGKCLPPSQEATAAIEGEFICPRRSSLLRLQRRPLRTVPSPGARARRGETAPAKKPSVKKPSVKKPSVKTPADSGGRRSWARRRRGRDPRVPARDFRVFSLADGLAAQRWGIRNTLDTRLDTRFDTASITKLFTSVAALQLVGRGTLDLETSRPRSATTSTSKAPR